MSSRHHNPFLTRKHLYPLHKRLPLHLALLNLVFELLVHLFFPSVVEFHLLGDDSGDVVAVEDGAFEVADEFYLFD
jgi:hypothetical protein